MREQVARTIQPADSSRPDAPRHGWGGELLSQSPEFGGTAAVQRQQSGLLSLPRQSGQLRKRYCCHARVEIHRAKHADGRVPVPGAGEALDSFVCVQSSAVPVPGPADCLLFRLGLQSALDRPPIDPSHRGAVSEAHHDNERCATAPGVRPKQ